MKKLLLLLVLPLGLLVGCAHMPVASNALTYSEKLTSDQVLDAAVDAARVVKLPPVTKLDKANGIVTFGGFGMPQLGLSAQVQVRSGHTLDVAVQRGSVYVPLGAGGKATEFRNALETELQKRAGEK